MSLSKDYGIVLFDGVCNLCNHAVDFVIKRDRGDRFKFASLQEPFFSYFSDQPNLVFVFIV
jgi:predicted DCC family thiol-disulfide oxidoreductase YuxK